MDLREILNDHRTNFRKRIIRSLAAQHDISEQEVSRRFNASIENIISSRYTPLEHAVDAICSQSTPVVLNIRRDRQREDQCKICESNEPNIQALDELFGDSISIFEISEDDPAGALYHVLFQGEPDQDRKLPLTAVIHNCEVKKVWAGKEVETSVYAGLIRKARENKAQ